MVVGGIDGVGEAKPLHAANKMTRLHPPIIPRENIGRKDMMDTSHESFSASHFWIVILAGGYYNADSGPPSSMAEHTAYIRVVRGSSPLGGIGF